MHPTPSLRAIRPDVPPGLDAVVFRCLEKDRQRRYRNIAELAVALVEFAPKRARALVERVAGTIEAAGLSAGVTAIPPSPQQPETMLSAGLGSATSAPVSSTGSPIRATRPRRSAPIVIGIVTVVVLGGAGIWATRTSRQQPLDGAGTATGSATPTRAVAISS